MDENIQGRLKKIRGLLGFTQRQISEVLGIKASYYSDLENGHRAITGKFISKLQNKFFISADWMYTGKGAITTLNSNQNLYPKNVPTVVPTKEGISQEEWSKQRIADFISKFSNSENTGYPKDYFNDDIFYLKANFEKKLLLDIIHNFPKINELHSHLSDLKSFEYVIGNLNHYYFNKIDLQFNSAEKYFKKGVFNYEKYRDDYFAELKKLDKLNPALHKISGAIKQFYKDIKEFDTENIIDGYFGKEKV